MRSQIFISYCHKDKKWLDDLHLMLKPLVRREKIEVWDDTKIKAGAEWYQKIAEALASASVAVLLVSPDFLASDFITEYELPPLLDAAQEDGLTILWIAVRDSLYNETEIGKYQAVNDPTRPLASLSPHERDRELVKIAKSIKEAASSQPSADAFVSAGKTDREKSHKSGSSNEHVAVTPGKRVVLLCKHKEHLDEHVLVLLESVLSTHGYRVFTDKDREVGIEWAKAIERELIEAYAVIPLISAASVSSEMFAYQTQMAHDAGQHKDMPHLLPVRVNYDEPLRDPLASILNPLRFMSWRGPHDDSSLTKELLASLLAPPTPTVIDLPKPASIIGNGTPLDPPWGAVPLNSKFYVTRQTDRLFSIAIAQNHGIVRVKGARQMGKTSLLARGLQEARNNGAKVVVTDFQSINSNNLASMDLLFQILGRMIADQLELSVFPKEVWDPDDGPNGNFRRYMGREVLKKISGPLIWGLDEVDALFTYDIGKEVFAFFRSLFNARELEPDGPWRRLTLAIVYATEAHLFINDPNMSPFNVGTPLELHDFDLEQVEVMNHRHGKLLTGEELITFYDLLGGHPYLVRRGFYELRTQHMSFGDFMAQADRDEGPFGDHLRRMLVLLARDSEMSDEMRNVLRGRNCSNKESFYRLRSAGVVSGDTERNVRLRCKLYQLYLSRYLL
jgi:hypothetical protein